MAFTCKNGREHQHETVHEARVCWGLIKPASRPAPPPTVGPVTKPQLNYIDFLKGDMVKAAKMNVREASAYIDALKKAKAAGTKVAAMHAASAHVCNFDTITGCCRGCGKSNLSLVEPEPEPLTTRKTSKTDMILGLVSLVPDGYFAVQRDEGEEMTFMRLKRPTHGKQKGTIKFQTQHGPRLEDAWVYWPSSERLDIYKHTIEDKILLLIADYQTAMKRYAKEKGKCLRCNTDLTDPRSRHYGIGPDCEQVLQWVIDQKDEEVGMPWERLPAHLREGL